MSDLSLRFCEVSTSCLTQLSSVNSVLRSWTPRSGVMLELDTVHLTLASSRSIKMISMSSWRPCARGGRTSLNVSQGFTLYHSSHLDI